MKMLIVHPLKNCKHGIKACQLLYLKELQTRGFTDVIDVEYSRFLRVDGGICKSPDRSKTCNCWACRSLRWKLFTKDQLNYKGSLYGLAIRI